jgi:hypothetical protein
MTPERADAHILPLVKDGLCHVLFAFDVGLTIDLDEAEKLIPVGQKGRFPIRKRRRAPRHFEFRPAPIWITLESSPVAIGTFATLSAVEVHIYEVGAVSVKYGIPFAGSLTELMPLSEALYDDVALANHARALVEDLLERLRPAVRKPSLVPFSEAYSVFQVREFDRELDAGALSEPLQSEIARLLRSESLPLSEQEIADATSSKVTYSTRDFGFVDWNAAFLYDRDAEDVLAVLEFSNIALLELRFLDSQLDDVLDEFHERLVKKKRLPASAFGSMRGQLRRIATFQVHSVVLYEEISNALKLFGDQYLARVYRMASRRLHLDAWDSVIRRKLEALESIYQKLNDARTDKRLEQLEWIIILLIAIEIVLQLIPGLHFTLH